jgi:hypothetical protein
MNGYGHGGQAQYHGGPAGYDERNYPQDQACVAVEEPLTTQITNRLDQALKNSEQLASAIAMRADSLFGPEPKNTLSNEKVPPPMLDRGVMDRISRQSRELLRALEAMEYQFRRFNQL